MSAPGPWLAPKELSAQLGVHLRTVRRWIAGHNPSLEVAKLSNRCVRVRLRDVTTCHRDDQPVGS